MNKVLHTPHGYIRFSLKKTFWLYVMIIPIFFIDFSSIAKVDFLINISLLFLTVGIGHSVGLHRGIIHKSYKTSKVFRKVSLYLFTLTGLGSPLNWLKQHYFRDYWQNRIDCPRYFQYNHSLLTDFYWNLHLTFIPKEINRYKIPKEDLLEFELKSNPAVEGSARYKFKLAIFEDGTPEDLLEFLENVLTTAPQLLYYVKQIALEVHPRECCIERDRLSF